MEQEPVRVLFVCLANISRSPMAEALLRNKAELAGLQDKIVVDSAGVRRYHGGTAPHEGTIDILKSHGISCDHKPRTIQGEDLQTFDYILAMDNEILRSVWAMGKGKAKALPLVKYAPGCGFDDVPDPVRTRRFDDCYDLLNKACDGFLATIRRVHGI